MNKIRKYFGEIEMTWSKVLIFAVIAAVITAGLNEIHALNETSFQDIAISYECWILFAVFIIVNCKTWWEASLKCFVFFLVSQPLIYLLEVPFEADGWGIFQYYRFWFIMTVLTLPGAAIAFQLKRKNWLSVAVLSVATAFLAAMCVNYFGAALRSFPHHLLSSIFCLALAVFFVFVLLDDKKHRIAALAVIAVAIAVTIGITAIGNSKAGYSTNLTLTEGQWVCTVEDESIADVEITNGNWATITSKANGDTMLTFKSNDGDESQTAEYYFVADGRNLSLIPLE